MRDFEKWVVKVRVLVKKYVGCFFVAPTVRTVHTAESPGTTYVRYMVRSTPKYALDIHNCIARRYYKSLSPTKGQLPILQKYIAVDA